MAAVKEPLKMVRMKEINKELELEEMGVEKGSCREGSDPVSELL